VLVAAGAGGGAKATARRRSTTRGMAFGRSLPVYDRTTLDDIVRELRKADQLGALRNKLAHYQRPPRGARF
jgi:hypothetical protein